MSLTDNLLLYLSLNQGSTHDVPQIFINGTQDNFVSFAYVHTFQSNKISVEIFSGNTIEFNVLENIIRDTYIIFLLHVLHDKCLHIR